MADDDVTKNPQQAMVKLWKGTIPYMFVEAQAIGDGVVVTHDTVITNEIKRILGRIYHIQSDAISDGKVTIEFSDEDDFSVISFFETFDLNTSNPEMTLLGTSVAADVVYYYHDLDIETMGLYSRVKVRNDSGAAKEYKLHIRGKVS